MNLATIVKVDGNRCTAKIGSETVTFKNNSTVTHRQTLVVGQTVTIRMSRDGSQVDSAVAVD